MAINKVSAGRGAAWVNESISLLRTGGKAIWIPALIVGILGALPVLGALLGVLIIFFYGGLLLAFNQPNGGHNVFSGFKNGGFARLLPIMVLNIVFAAVSLYVIWPSLQPVFDAAMNGAKLNEAEAIAFVTAFGKHLLWLIPMSIFIGWITQFAVPLASLSAESGGNAIIQALQAIKSNLPALIVNFICLFIVIVVVSVLLIIPMALLSAVLASNPMLMNIAILPFTAMLTAILVALMSGNMLFAYRDVFGQSPETTKNTEVLI